MSSASASSPGSLGASDLNAVVGRTLALLPDLGLPDHSEAEGAKLRRLWVVWQTGAVRDPAP